MESLADGSAYKRDKTAAILDAELDTLCEATFDLTHHWLMNTDPHQEAAKQIGSWLDGNVVEVVCIGAGRSYMC